jgi:hypothetical protein
MDPGISLRTSTGAMNPDHPMLQRAQQALARQLNAKRMRVEGELREKQTALQVCPSMMHLEPLLFYSHVSTGVCAGMFCGTCMSCGRCKQHGTP